MKESLCVDCHTIGKPRKVIKGNVVAEIFLWCLFLLPGMIYTVWRLSTRHLACRACGGSTLIPVDAPRARQILGADPEHTEKPSGPRA